MSEQILRILWKVKFEGMLIEDALNEIQKIISLQIVESYKK